MAYDTAEKQEILQKLSSVDVLKPIAPYGSSRYAEEKHEGKEQAEVIKGAIGFIHESRNKQHAVWQVFKATLRNPKLSLRLNSYTGDLVFRGHSYSLERLYKTLCETFEAIGLLPFNTFQMFLAVELEHFTYNPVADYLRKCQNAHPDAWEGWDTLANDIFGADDELSQEMLTAFLIGSVARAMEPGCIMRQCLVLQGGQEIGKTQFIRTLYSPELYASRDAEMSDADVYRQLQHCWVMELEEMEAIASKRSVENLKRFISVQEDEYRALYTEKPKKHPRKAVLVGTVNSSEFLRDETGNSRFWVIPVPGQVNLGYVVTYRDRIWAEAYRRYTEGEAGWNKELSRKAQARANEFQVSNSLEEPVSALLERIRTQVTPKHQEALLDIAFTSSDLLTALGVKVTEHSKHSKKTAQALAALGYVKKAVKVAGRTVRLYTLPEVSPVTVQFVEGTWKKMG